MKTAVLTTVYQGIEPYLEDFLRSLEEQTNKEFVLVAVNDGLPSLDSYMRDFRLGFEIVEAGKGSTIASNREAGIRYCLSNEYRNIIFADSDDMLHQRRIERCTCGLIDF